MERWEAKVLSLFVCLVALFAAVALPIKVSQLFYSQGKRGERWLDIVNCFGGGVFLGTYLVTFPQVRVLIEDALLKPSNIHYPLPEVLVGAGFFMIMFLEKIISSTNKATNKAKETHDHSAHNTTELKQSDTVVTFISDLSESITHNDYSNNIPPNAKNNSNPNGVLNNDHINDLSNGDAGHGNNHHNTNKHHGNVLSDGEDITANGHSNPAFTQDSNETTAETTQKKEITTNDSKEPPQEESSDPEPEVDFTSALKALILMAALAIDNVFIGMGLGLRDTQIGVWNMLITILSHELVISFTLAHPLVKHNSTKKVLILAAVYASMCPIGIGIGTILLDTGVVGEGVELVSGILQALAAGVFLYVTFFEILEGHVGHHSNIPCLLAILAGFVLMCLLALLEEDTGEETKMFHMPKMAASTNATTASLLHDIHGATK